MTPSPSRGAAAAAAEVAAASAASAGSSASAAGASVGGDAGWSSSSSSAGGGKAAEAETVCDSSCLAASLGNQGPSASLNLREPPLRKGFANEISSPTRAGCVLPTPTRRPLTKVPLELRSSTDASPFVAPRISLQCSPLT